MRSLIFFFRFFGWFCLRYARLHLGRVLIVVLGISLGAAVFTSVRLSIHASVDAFSSSMNLIAGRADRVLFTPGGRVPEATVAAMIRHPMVAAVSPISMSYVRAERADVRPFLLVGFDPILDRPFRSWRSRTGTEADNRLWTRLISEPYTLIVGARLSEQTAAAGDTLILEHLHHRVEFTCIGVLDRHGVGRIDGGRVAFTDMATFQEFTGRFGVVDRIDMRFRDGTAPSAIEHLAAALPDDVVMGRPDATRESGLQMIRAYQLNLSILSFVSLFVGMFLVYSLVALNAVSRRRELAILRSVGASERQLFFLFLFEGALLGLAGWLLAVPASSLLVRHLLHGISQTISTLFVPVQVDRLVLAPWEICLSFGVTLLVSVAAAAQPAGAAMRVSPKAVMTENPGLGRDSGAPERLAVAGLLAIAAVFPLAAVPGPPGLPLPGYLATFLLFSGFAMLSPWLLRTMGRRLSTRLRRLGGEPAVLAGRYLQASGQRTAISVGALITATALFCALVIMVHSFRQTVELWVVQTISGDVFVRPKMAEINRYRDPMPADSIAAIQELRTPVDRLPYHRIYLRYGTTPFQFETVDFDMFRRHGRFLWVAGAPEAIHPDLVAGKGVVITEVFANLADVRVGDIFRTRIGRRMIVAPVLGIARDYRTHGGVVFYAIEPFNRMFGSPPWSGVRLFLRTAVADPAAASADLAAEVRAATGDQLEVTEGHALRRAILTVFDETFAVTTVLLLIALTVAALGIASTLSVLVLERTRQFNTLFAVGGSFRQIRSIVFWEAMLMVAAGEAAGLICGMVLSYLLIFVINAQSFGWTFLYRVNWTAIGMAVPLIAAAALLSALPAAKLIFRQPPSTLLRQR